MGTTHAGPAFLSAAPGACEPGDSPGQGLPCPSRRHLHPVGASSPARPPKGGSQTGLHVAWSRCRAAGPRGTGWCRHTGHKQGQLCAQGQDCPVKRWPRRLKTGGNPRAFGACGLRPQHLIWGFKEVAFAVPRLFWCLLTLVSPGSKQRPREREHCLRTERLHRVVMTLHLMLDGSATRKVPEQPSVCPAGLGTEDRGLAKTLFPREPASGRVRNELRHRWFTRR